MKLEINWGLPRPLTNFENDVLNKTLKRLITTKPTLKKRK